MAFEIRPRVGETTQRAVRVSPGEAGMLTENNRTYKPQLRGGDKCRRPSIWGGPGEAKKGQKTRSKKEAEKGEKGGPRGTPKSF